MNLCNKLMQIDFLLLNKKTKFFILGKDITSVKICLTCRTIIECLYICLKIQHTHTWKFSNHSEIK